MLPVWLQILALVINIALIVIGVIVWAQRWYVGSEKASAKGVAEEDAWKKETGRCIQSLGSRMDRANDEMSKVAGSWMVKVAQIDEHLRSTDNKVITIEVTLTGMRDAIRTNENHITKIEQDGCVYGKENRKQLDRMSNRNRGDGDHR